MAAAACGPLLDDGRVPTVVDPACGTGALLRAALAVLLDAGVPVAAAASALHGVELDPVAVALCRAALDVDLRRAARARAVVADRGADAGVGAGTDGRVGGHSRARIRRGDALLGPVPALAPDDLLDEHAAADPHAADPHAADPAAFAWHRAFPDVLARPDGCREPVTGWRGGFDVVLANPPWERWKVHARDWAGVPPPELRGTRAKASAQVREAGRHPLSGRGEVNAYLPFLETCWRLLAPDGRAAVVVPAGVATDRSASRLVLALVASGSLERLRALEEGEAAFSDVSARVPVAVVHLRHGAGRAAAEGGVAAAGEGCGCPPAVVETRGGGRWPLDAALMRLVGPNVPTVPLCAGRAEHDLLRSTHERWPVLVPRDPAGEPVEDGQGWRARFVTPLHMSRDARHFRTAPGPGLLPLWEAKHAALLDHRGGSVGQPRYWVPEELMAARHADLWARGWLAGFRNVSVADGVRTLLPCALPRVGVGNSLPLVDSPHLALLLALLAGAPVDHLLRARHSGANLNFFKLEQLPLPPPQRFERRGRDGVPFGVHVLAALVGAMVWHDDGPHGLADELRARLGVHLPPRGPGGGDRAGRARARARLDAAAAWALGWDAAQLRTAFAGFGRWRAREEAEYGRFVARDDALAAHEEWCDLLGDPG